MKELKITYEYLKENGYNPYYKDGKLTIDGSFDCSCNKLTSLQIPDNFTVGGSFACSNNNLISLQIPDNFTVGSCFDCSDNELTSLQIPNNFIISGYFDCSYNKLKSLQISDNVAIGGSFCCYYNNLTSLQIPDSFAIGCEFDCSHNELTSLQIPDNFTVGRGFYCHHNNLTSLQIPDNFTVGTCFDCSNNELILLHIPNNFTVGGVFNCSRNKLTSLQIPDNFKVGDDFYCDKQTIFNQKPKKLQQGYHGTYCYYDGILRPVRKVKHLGNLTAYISPLGVVLVDEHENSAHGKDIKTAYRDLIFKTTSQDAEQYRNADLEEERNLSYLYTAYRNITGSCQQGTEAFISQYGLTDENRPKSIREAVAFTKERNAYRYKIFEDFFSKKC